jgi:hypothetical protein
MKGFKLEATKHVCSHAFFLPRLFLIPGLVLRERKATSADSTRNETDRCFLRDCIFNFRAMLGLSETVILSGLFRMDTKCTVMFLKCTRKNHTNLESKLARQIGMNLLLCSALLVFLMFSHVFSAQLSEYAFSLMFSRLARFTRTYKHTG